jgi:hypothetical protein
MSKGKIRSKTPRILLEATRYQPIVQDAPLCRWERRAAKAIMRKKKKPFITANILNDSFDME